MSIVWPEVDNYRAPVTTRLRNRRACTHAAKLSRLAARACGGLAALPGLAAAARALVLLPYSAAVVARSLTSEYAAAIPTQRPDLDADGARNQCTVGRRSIWKTADLYTTQSRKYLAADYGPANSGYQPWSFLLHICYKNIPILSLARPFKLNMYSDMSSSLQVFYVS